MDYIELTFTISNDIELVSDILSAELAEAGFESFVNSDKGFLAYVSADAYNNSAIQPIIDNVPVEATITFTENFIKGQNWNEEWEKNYFQPIIIGNECAIFSSFHKNVPKAKYEILIDPKMSFGTGHHETTSLVIGEILKTDMQRKSLLDMGCGTCILGILASMKGADPVTAIDIDEWCYENSIENLKLNKIDNVTVLKGDAGLLAGKKFDIILANINRNILLNDIKHYANCLPENGLLFMSGFYESDIESIKEECAKYGLELSGYETKNNWAVTKFIKR